MKFQRTSACVVLVLLLSACPGRDGLENMGRTAQNELISEGANRIVANGGNLPAPSASIAYRDENSFDLELYSSLRALNDVRVNFASPQQEVPTRLALWTTAVQRSGGASGDLQRRYRIRAGSRSADRVWKVGRQLDVGKAPVIPPLQTRPERERHH